MYSLWAFIAATGQRRSQCLHYLVVLPLFESGQTTQPFVASRAVAIVGVVDDDEAGSVPAAGLVQVASDFKSAVGGQESAEAGEKGGRGEGEKEVETATRPAGQRRKK